jgi:hypothetical protein
MTSAAVRGLNRVGFTMCDERERLIEFIYGETDLAERRRVEDHLTDCHVCRTEVAGLRGVRDDLLAWDVPKHDPIWRPVVPVERVAVWRRAPVWGLAAAAMVLFAAGAAGGMATRMWLPGPAPAPTAVPVVAATAPAVQQVPAAVTADDLARLEASILERVRGEMDGRLQAVSAAQAPPASALVPVGTGNRSRAGFEHLEARVATVEQWVDDQIALNNYFNGQFGRLNNTTSSLRDAVEMSSLRRVSLDGGGR